MHRFYLPPEHCRPPVLVLGGREAHHALHVLRARTGERVTVLDGAGGEFACEVQETGRESVHLRVLEQRRHALPAAEITLLQAIPKGKLFEWILEKATELGAGRVIPLSAERVVSQVSAEEGRRKAEKWRLTVIEAMKQCGAPWLPRIEPPMTPAEFLQRPERLELLLIASLQPGSRRPRECFREFQETHGGRPRTVGVWVGPEGDFTSAEIAAIQAGGALPITLGPRVLRAETAALYCLSVIGHELE